MRIVLAALLSFMMTAAHAEVTFEAARYGDHFVYVPSEPYGVLVVAHGTRRRDEHAQATARRLLGRWTEFADDNNLIVIAPVFDDARFGNRGGKGYGGYRGLFGKYVAADEFVLSLVAKYRETHTLRPDVFLLYGFSAGAQFAVRFAVRVRDPLILHCWRQNREISAA